MTWRAFILGLISVVGAALVDPYTSFNRGYGWNTQSHFPVAAVFVLALLTLALNAVLRLIDRRWILKRAELMLIWCMLIVGCAVPSNLMRFWPPVLAAPAYLARRPDIAWKDTALRDAPDALLLTKNPKSEAARQFFERRPEGGRIPWGQWLAPMSRWAVLMGLFYLATFFLCAILRRQWVDRERLQFPLARVPLEFTRPGGPWGFLPEVFASRAFLAGLGVAGALRLVRAAPLAFGAESGWNATIPLRDVFGQTPLEHLYLENFSLNWMPIGLAYLVPADVSLSIWLFYLFGRLELQTAAWLGSPLHYGGTYGELIRWQRAGAYIAFAVCTLFMARRHLWVVLRSALTRRADPAESFEPVGYGLATWGFLLCVAGAVGWFAWYGMRPWSAALLLALLFCIQIVHARLVAQSGLYRTSPLAQGPNLLNGLAFGHLFTPTGAVLAQMQYTIMINGNNSMLGPAAIHAFRIGEVFGRRRRLLLPALVVALAAAIAAASWTCVYQGYSGGALNYSNVWAAIDNPKGAFDLAHQMIHRPEQASRVRWLPFWLGIGLTGAAMFMRARFYWWPVHPVGLVALASYGLDRMWFSFLLGWLVKVSFLKFGTGRLLRQGRMFFIGFIVTELTVDGLWSLASLFTGGAVPGAGVWI